MECAKYNVECIIHILCHIQMDYKYFLLRTRTVMLILLLPMEFLATHEYTPVSEYCVFSTVRAPLSASTLIRRSSDCRVLGLEVASSYIHENVGGGLAMTSSPQCIVIDELI